MSTIVFAGHTIAQQPSPNKSCRGGRTPLVIVLHSTGGSYGSAVNWLSRPGSGVSAHYVVSRAGEITQLVDTSETAWHAGKAQWQGHTDVNSISIGIEQEHLDRQQDWPEAQLAAVADLVRALCAKWGISHRCVVGHNDVAVPRGRKIDPWQFPWERFRQLLG
jgi:N-acetylmuramoyl-L-alanine amidase